MTSEERRVRNAKASPRWLTKEQKKEMRTLYVVGHLVQMDVDHIIPLKGKGVCGLHVPWNLQLLTPELNQAKGISY